jgi:hypothetical protein
MAIVARHEIASVQIEDAIAIARAAPNSASGRTRAWSNKCLAGAIMSKSEARR